MLKMEALFRSQYSQKKIILDMKDIMFLQFNLLDMILYSADVAPEDVAAIHQAIIDYSKTDEFKDLAKNANYTPYLEDGQTVKQIILDTADLCKEAYDKYYAQ